MKWLCFLIIPLVSLAGALFAQGGGTLPEMTPQEREKFHTALDQELQKAQNRLYQLIQDFDTQKSAFDPAAKYKVDASKGTLKTKTILVNNFRWAPSTRSPRVRNALLSILKKNEITMDDLQELEKVVQQEKQKLEEESTQY